MAKLAEVNIEQLFVPEADLQVYEEMAGREIYLAMMTGVFSHHGLPTDERTIMKPFVGMYEAASARDKRETDDKIIVQSGTAEREVRVETSLLDDSYAGMNWPWGPSAAVHLSTMEDGSIVRLGAGAIQEHQELFMSADLKQIDPLTGEEDKLLLVESIWVGNTGNQGSDENPQRFFKETAFRDITPAEKRVFGVALEGLGMVASERSSVVR